MVSANTVQETRCCLDTELLPVYGLFEGQLPPTIMAALWHGAYSRNRNPFALCYYSHYPSLGVSEELRQKACEYLKRFGSTREEQTRNFKTSPSAKAYGVLKALLEAIYGKPVAKSVYYTAQPSVNINIDIRDETGEHVPVVLPTSEKSRHRPPLYGEKMVLITFHLPRQMLQALDEYARERGLTRSAVIRYAIAQMLKRVRKTALLLTQVAP